ncbi:ceruloplasmin-like isoform X2 [Ostrea edulis]|uniref:ceruloplasmin-like isoform X2 n=1 Tax=Ostrea edulis TaxID=37623 RepID=UPI0024AFC719|nr:ceruloplasmin-like isoform X2 [Ostrea edulis]
MDTIMIRLLCLSSVLTICYGKEIVYYIAIDEIDWPYKHADQSETVFRKAAYQEYKDQTFTTRKPVTSQHGFLGPTIRASVGNTLRILVKNNARRSFSFYTDNLNTQKNETGAVSVGSPVSPGSVLTYVYTVTDANGPSAASMDQCVTSLYYSDVNPIKDINTGLVGMLVVCKTDSPTSVREIFLHYGTMYERESWFSSVKSTNDSQQTVFPTINGYTEGNMPDIDVCLNRKVRLYFTSLGGQNDIHTVVLYGHQMEVRSQRVDAVNLYPGATVTAEFLTQEEGAWLLTTQHVSGNRKHTVAANSLKTYYWSVPDDVGPTLFDELCLVRHYTSGLGHSNDTFLFGPVKICAEGYMQTAPKETDIFVVYRQMTTSISNFEINGVPPYTLPLVSVCLEEIVNTHIMTFGTAEPQSFSVDGNVIKQRGHVLNVMEAKENSMTTYTITMTKTGNWTVRNFRNENISLTLSVNECGTSSNFILTGKVTTRNIGIKEDYWGYSSLSDWTSKLPGCQMGPRFKKAMFVEYYSNLFMFETRQPDPRDETLHGPQLAANVGDRITIEIKNNGRRPYSLHLDGLSDWSDDDSIPWDSSKIITWNILESIGPGSADTSCILKPYYSKTSQRDIPSGLFGPLVICSPLIPSETVESTLQQKVFMVGSIDERASWYYEDNLKDSTGIVNISDPKCADANVIRAVNGYSDGTIKNMTIPLGADVYFHFLNIGNNLLTIHLYGLKIIDSNQEGIGRSTITLYPWASKSIVTRFDSPGSFLYEELITEGHTTRISGLYTVVTNTKLS